MPQESLLLKTIYQIWLGHVKSVTIRDLNVEAVFTGFREKVHHDNEINRFHNNEFHVNLLLIQQTGQLELVINVSFKLVIRVVY